MEYCPKSRIQGHQIEDYLLKITSGNKTENLHNMGIFEYAEFKNGRNQTVSLTFPAEKSKFKMAAMVNCFFPVI